MLSLKNFMLFDDLHLLNNDLMSCSNDYAALGVQFYDGYKGSYQAYITIDKVVDDFEELELGYLENFYGEEVWQGTVEDLRKIKKEFLAICKYYIKVPKNTYYRWFLCANGAPYVVCGSKCDVKAELNNIYYDYCDCIWDAEKYGDPLFYLLTKKEILDNITNCIDYEIECIIESRGQAND